MCGLCGIVDLNGKSLEPGPVIRRMTRTLTHRGPDDEGYFEAGAVALGHRRLKVIDLEGGRQPMTSQDGRVSMVFNGEIYNFREIRARLEKKGRRFLTHSDTESLLQSYEENGLGLLSDIEGMYAFAVWDQNESALYLVADRFGKKPLYYTITRGLIIFASELRALLKHPSVSRDIDENGLSHYLSFEYVPAPYSIMKGIRKLEAGTYLKAKDGKIEIHRYHEHDFHAASSLSEKEAEALFMDLFAASVRKRLVADVPLGVFLSGGVDSTSTLALMKMIDPGKKIKTFTVRFDDPSFDESAYARKAADYFRTDHIEEHYSASSMLKDHAAMLDHLDEPMADGSYIPTFALCRLARRHVTVVLGGDGGDELFGGYPTFLADSLARSLTKMPQPMIRLMEAFVQKLPVSLDNLSFDFRLKQFFKGLPHSGFERNQVWLGAFSAMERKKILGSHAGEDMTVLFKSNGRDSKDFFRELRDFYFRFYLQGDILVKTDRASMANSLEVRSPFLDDSLVKSMMRLPSNFMVRGFKTKYLLKKAMLSRIPREIIQRPKKGFGIPMSKWIRKELKDDFKRALDPSRLRRDGLFDPKEVSSILNDHLSGKKDNRKRLWTLYVFQRWKNRWL